MGDQIEEIENALSYFYQEDADPELYEQSAELRQQLSSSVDNLKWFLQDPPFTKPTTYKTAFECFKFRLYYYPDEFDEETLGRLHTFLFENTIERTKILPQNEILDICTAQAYLSILIFPDIFPQLFDMIFDDDYPDPLRFRFLAEFCQCLVLPTPQNIERINKIKSSFDEFSFYEQIIIQIKNGIQQEIPDAVTALASFTRWTKDLSYIFDDQLMEAIFSNESPGFVLPVLKLIGSISQRNIPEKKEELIQNFDIPGRIGFYCENYKEYDEIISGCADLIPVLGYSLGTPLPEMHDLIEFFFQESDELSEKVAGYYRAFVRDNPNETERVVTNVIKRIIVFFETNPVTTFDHYLSTLFQILQECAIQNSDIFFQGYASLLSSVQESEVSENLASLSALIAVSCSIFMSGIPFVDELKDRFFVTVRNIFDIEPPLENEQLFFPIYGLNRSFLYRDIRTDVIASDYNKDVLSSLSKFSLDENLPDEVRKHFAVLLLKYVQQRRTYCSILPEYFEGFLSSRSKELMEVVGIAFDSIISQNKIVFAQKCLEIIDQNFLTEDASFEDVSLSLDFFSHFKAPEVAYEVASDIYRNISKLCTENDELLGKLILATSGIGIPGFQLFYELLNSLEDGIFSVQGAAETTCYFCSFFKKSQDNENFENAIGIANALFHCCVNAINNALSMPLSSKDAQQTRLLISSFYKLLRCCYESFSSDEQLVGYIFVFTRELMIRCYNKPIVLSTIYRFLAYISQAIPREVASNFTEPSLIFILAPNFDPDNLEWEQMIPKLVDFQSILVESAYKEFSESLSSTLSGFGLDPFIQDYNISLEKEKDPREKYMLTKQVLLGILAARNSMTW